MKKDYTIQITKITIGFLVHCSDADGEQLNSSYCSTEENVSHLVNYLLYEPTITNKDIEAQDISKMG